MLELLAKLADVAFHDVLVDVFIEDPVNGVEDLGLREPAAAIANEAFEDPALAAREGQGLAAHFSLASVEIDFEVADRDVAVFAHDAAADRADASEDLADMDGFAEHVIDAGGEEAEGVVERRTLLQAENGRFRALTDELGKMFATMAVADQESLNGLHIAFAGLGNPFAEFVGVDPRGRHAFPVEAERITASDNAAIVDDDVHVCPVVLVVEIISTSRTRTRRLTLRSHRPPLGVMKPLRFFMEGAN